VECTGYKEEDGKVTEVYAKLISNEFGGKAPEGIKPKGTIHWLSTSTCIKVKYRLFNSLFKDGILNNDSLIEKNGYLECRPYSAGERYQLERVGYFYITDEEGVINRIVPLKDGYNASRNM
jgi:glutaminyl-tRNA synthetase